MTVSFFKIASLMDFCAMDISEIWKGYVAGVDIIAGKSLYPTTWDRYEAGAAASRESKASLLQSAISSQDCLKEYLTKVRQLTSGKRNKKRGRETTGDVLPVSLDIQELKSCAAALMRGELDDRVNEAKLEELEEFVENEEELKSNAFRGLNVVNEVSEFLSWKLCIPCLYRYVWVGGHIYHLP